MSTFVILSFCTHIFENNISNHNFPLQNEAHSKNPTCVLFLAHDKYRWKHLLCSYYVLQKIALSNILMTRLIITIITTTVLSLSIRRWGWRGAHMVTSVCRGQPGSHYHHRAQCRRRGEKLFIEPAPDFHQVSAFNSQRDNLGNNKQGQTGRSLRLVTWGFGVWRHGVGDIIGSVCEDIRVHQAELCVPDGNLRYEQAQQLSF